MEWRNLLNTNKELKVVLGNKKVPVPKITYYHFKNITEKIDTLPVLVGSIVAAPKESLKETIFVACELGFEEVLEIVSILTGLEVEYLQTKVGLSEVASYLVKVAEVNDYYEAVQNIKSLFNKDGGE